MLRRGSFMDNKSIPTLSIGHQYMYIHDVYIICCRTKWLSATVTTCSCLWHLSSAFCRHSFMPLIHTVSNRLFILRDNLTSNKRALLIISFCNRNKRDIQYTIDNSTNIGSKSATYYYKNSTF